MRYSFEWDPNEAERNRQKHRVSFERAAEVFLDPFALSLFDDEHSDMEDRWLTLGKDTHEVLMVVIHTFQEVDEEERRVRIISVRKATSREAGQYDEGSFYES